MIEKKTVAAGKAAAKRPPSTSQDLVRGRHAPAKVPSGGVVDLREGKTKLVRDSFTIPKAEYVVLGSLKDRAANLRRPTKKSELLRAGVAALAAMNDRAFLAALAKVPSLKTGRPKDGPG